MTGDIILANIDDSPGLCFIYKNIRNVLCKRHFRTGFDVDLDYYLYIITKHGYRRNTINITLEYINDQFMINGHVVSGISLCDPNYLNKVVDWVIYFLRSCKSEYRRQKAYNCSHKNKKSLLPPFWMGIK